MRRNDIVIKIRRGDKEKTLALKQVNADYKERFNI